MFTFCHMCFRIFFKWWRLKVKFLPFSLQCVCFFLSLDVTMILLCSHDVTMYLFHIFMLSLYTYASETSAYFLYCSVFNLYNWLHILIFFFSATCFFSLIFLSSIHFNYWIYLFVWMYLPSPFLGTFRLFSNLRFTGTGGMKFMIMTLYVLWKSPSRVVWVVGHAHWALDTGPFALPGSCNYFLRAVILIQIFFF